MRPMMFTRRRAGPSPANSRSCTSLAGKAMAGAAEKLATSSAGAPNPPTGVRSGYRRPRRRTAWKNSKAVGSAASRVATSGEARRAPSIRLELALAQHLLSLAGADGEGGEAVQGRVEPEKTLENTRKQIDAATSKL